MPDGQQVLTRLVQLRADAIYEGSDSTATLLAAVFAEALQQDLAPRAVLDGLWTSAPADDDWHDRLRETLTEALDTVEN